MYKVDFNYVERVQEVYFATGCLFKKIYGENYGRGTEFENVKV